MTHMIESIMKISERKLIS